LKLILNLILFLVVFGFARRVLLRLLRPSTSSRPSGETRGSYPDADPGRASGRHAAFDKDEAIEDAEFEELD
jgi:hypothetical protein